MECDHCDATVDSRREEIDHVLADHGDDLTSHERDALKRERNELSTETGGSLADRLPAGRGAGMAVLFLGLAAVLLYGMVATGVLSFSAGSPTGTATAPANIGPAGSAHDHATFSVSVEGERIDFSQPRYQFQQTQNSKIHFEAGDGTTIHKHATGVTVGYALESLGLGLNGTCLAVHGDTYCESSGSVVTTVDGTEFDNGDDHVIRDGETIRIRYTEN